MSIDDKGEELRRRRTHKRLQKIAELAGAPPVALSTVPSDKTVAAMIQFLTSQLSADAIAGMLAGMLLQTAGEKTAKAYVLALVERMPEVRKQP